MKIHQRKAAEVVPTDFTTIFTNSNIDITNDIEDDFGVFRFTNYGTRFVEVTLTATSVENISYPTGSLVIKDAEYHTIKQCEIAGYSNNAINYNNNNSLTVFLPASGYYFIEVNYDMTDITKLELSVNVINTSNTINLFNYSPSEQFSISPFTNSSRQDKISQFVLKQSTKFTISVTNSSQMTDGYRFVLLKRDTSNVASTFIVVKNEVISINKNYTFALTEGTYYVGYFALNESNNVTISMTRNLTSYGSSYLVPDPDVGTPCGSQINVEEADINIYNRSYRQTNITEGFTRLIYLDSLAPSLSRLDYYWYSSNEDVATITDYGTVLALPVNTSQETVRIMAVYKYDMSKCYVKEFVVKNDTSTYSSDPIDIYLDMTAQVGQYISIDLNDVDVPINFLQYYSWTVQSGGFVDSWGQLYAYNASLGTTLSVTGVYQYNTKVKIHIDALVVLPLSGYEHDYNTALWDDDVENNNNCYAYAINNQVIPGTNTLWWKQQPGEYDNAVTYNYNDEEKMFNAVTKDFEKYNELFGTNLVFQRIGKFQKCPVGTYKVALVANSSNWDYHWYRQDSDGYWSHKPGTTPLTRYDSNGNLIVDPQICARGIYDVFHGFYAVSGWDNMYDESENLLLNLLETSISQNSENIVLNNKIQNLEIGMTHNEVISLFGIKGLDIGCGTLIEQYSTENDNIIKIYYNLVDNNYIVVNFTIEGGE